MRQHGAMSTDSEIRHAMIELLGTGAMSRDDLLAAVRALDASAGRTAEQILRKDSAFSDLDDVCYVPALVEGTSWTFGVDADDAAEGFVRMHPALSPLGWWLISSGAELIDDASDPVGEVGTDGIWLDGRDTDVLVGPPGWLDAVAGGLATLTVRSEQLQVTQCDAPPQPTLRQIDAMRVGFERMTTSKHVRPFGNAAAGLPCVPSDHAVLAALLHDRDAFVEAAIPHLDDLYAAAGLEQRHHLLAANGFDWEAQESSQQRNKMHAFYGLDEPQIDMLTTLIGVCELHIEKGDAALGPNDDDRGAAAALMSTSLDDGDVGEAFWVEMLARYATPHEIEAFADTVASRMAGADPVGVGWILSQCMAMRDDEQGAVALVDSLAGPGCDHVPLLLDAAAAMSDRGDALTAMRLLARAGISESDLVDFDPATEDLDEPLRLLIEVLPYARNRPKAKVGRNEPCPCGSGRKYKACHLGKERHDLVDRSSWLYDKTLRYIRARAFPQLHELADELADGSYEISQELSSSPFLMDLAVHELDMMSEFLDARGWLLPDDERLLAEQWMLVDRSVFEILEARDEVLRLRDVGSGETITVTNTHPSDATRPGMMMIGRPLPVGDTHRAMGGFLSAPPQLVNPFLDAIAADDVDELIALLAQMLRPPQLRNTSGEELVFHTTRWQIAETDDLHARLAAAGFVGDDDGEWNLTEDTSSMRDAILATLHLDADDDVLRAETNSDERASMVRTVVDDALPTAKFLGDQRREFDELRAEMSDDDESGLLDPNDPEVRQMMEEMMRTKEIEWLDQEVPALDGRTPRASVTDPIGREKVARLLASFPEPQPGGFVGFSPSRLRAHLGLDD